MEDSLFLTPDEMHHWSGRKHKAKQIEWLRLEGIPFRVAMDGRPRVLRKALEGGKTTPPPQPQRAWMPRVIGAA